MSAADARRPVVELTLADPVSLENVVKWTELANGLYFPDSSPVSVAGGRLTVSAYLTQTMAPGVEES